MGRIVTSVTITNVKEPSRTFRCDALVDTGATYMVLPSAWKDRLADLELIETAELSTATQPITGEIRGPVEIQLEGFRRVHTDVVFVDMEPDDGRYDPLVGYVVLEQSHAAVDMLGHRLVHVKRMDLKQALRRWRPAGPPRASGPGRTYLRLPDDGNRYQIIEGVLYVTPVPGSKSGPGGHATVSGDL